MASLRNAVKRITHKERAQPRARAHLGVLEKHGDYKQRADDYHRKERHIQRLRTKAAQRNPDEFYFGMTRTVIKDGKHQKTAQARSAEFDATIGHETIRLMKDQDLSYIRMQKQKDTRKAEKLQSSLHLLDNDDETSIAKRKHTIFVESEAEAQNFDVAQHFDTLPDMVHRSFHRPRLSNLITETEASKQSDGDRDDDEAKPPPPTTTAELRREEKQANRLARRLVKAREGSYRELQERTTRAAKLARAEAHLVTEKLLAGKGRKRKIQAAEQGKPAVYKWRRKRLR